MRWSSIGSLPVVLSLVVGAVSAADPPKAVSGKASTAKASGTMFDPRVRPLLHQFQGPFVKMADGAVVGVNGDCVLCSVDGVREWSLKGAEGLFEVVGRPFVPPAPEQIAPTATHEVR